MLYTCWRAPTSLGRANVILYWISFRGLLIYDLVANMEDSVVSNECFCVWWVEKDNTRDFGSKRVLPSMPAHQSMLRQGEWDCTHLAHTSSIYWYRISFVDIISTLLKNINLCCDKGSEIVLTHQAFYKMTSGGSFEGAEVLPSQSIHINPILYVSQLLQSMKKKKQRMQEKEVKFFLGCRQTNSVFSWNNQTSYLADRF